jgi:hypothetical protein
MAFPTHFVLHEMVMPGIRCGRDLLRQVPGNEDEDVASTRRLPNLSNAEPAGI